MIITETNMKHYFLGVLLLLLANTKAQTTAVPFTNTFDNWPIDTLGWSHYAISGTDDWQVGIPNNSTYFSGACTSPYAWGTNLTGNFAANSNRALETPFFNLTNTGQHMAFSFQHKVNKYNSLNQFKLEYKIGANGVWQLLDNTLSNKKNWQNSSGFSTYYATWRTSAIDLFFIQGQDSVKFRFRLSSQNSDGNGWLIDNFSIQPEYYNVTAVPGDTIKGINSLFTNFNVTSNYNFNNQYSNSYYLTDRFYFSNDNILDAGDYFLGEVNHWVGSTISNWNNTFSLPVGLNAGSYYIFYEYDVNDSIVENNENDNVNFAVLVLDSIYTTNYVEDFDTSIYVWNSNLNVNNSQWKRGDPNNWHLEDPRSGNNAWFSGIQVTNENYLESPYLDLSNSVNNSICWWYKTSRNNYNPSYFYLQKPTFGTTSISTPYFYSPNSVAGYNVPIPKTRYYGWDCHCEDLTNYDGEQSTKFRFLAYGKIEPINLDQVLIDDVYIGEKKPDAGIGGEQDNRFTASSLSTDTLNYLMFNSGLQQLPTTTTEFYWSNDSILDGTDIYLGSEIEPAINDTSFMLRKFEYSKPTTLEGEYFIIYILDAGNMVNEMREYDNIGYFKIYQTYQSSLPYSNNFETSIQGWRHNATLGEDNWEWDVPSGTILNSAFSGQKAFCTNASGNTSFKSRMHLYTPVFDMTQLVHPVLEFDLFNAFTSSGYSLWPFNMGNMMYSVDGGNSWKVLKTESDSYKKWYSQTTFESISGIEQTSYVEYPYGEILYMKNAPFFGNYYSYQGRDYDIDDTYHYVIDLEHLKNEKQIQFMIVYANHDAPVEGMLLDNFEIKEASIDLMVQSHKKLMVSSSDKQLKTFFYIKNNENYISDSTSIRIYVSEDTLLDVNDFFLHQEIVPKITPYKKHLINLVMNTPSNYGQYNYLIYELDEGNYSIEVDESNNIGYLDLAMDTATNYNYPILFDFESEEIDGWTWWHDSTGYYHGHRFRHKTINPDYLNYPEDGIWFLDPIDLLGYSTMYSGYPRHHLEPPSFDFSELSIIEMTFDYISVGSMMSGSNSQGGNISYSIDGGENWIILDQSQDPYAENWYNQSSVASLNGEPGWGYKPNWTHAKYNLSFLGGQSNVRFRFNWRSEFRTSSQGMHGFRLDNFKIDGKYNDLKASSTHPTISIDPNTEQSFPLTYEIENIGYSDVPISKTNIYWSTDTILNVGDSLLYTIPENIFNENSTFTGLQTIHFPTPILQQDYYVLYFTDADSTLNESNETNNLGWWKINFLDTSHVDLESIPLISPVFTDIFSNWFYFEFDYSNNGNFISDSALVTVHWSEDQLLDISDILLYNIHEPRLDPTDYITHAGNIYFPHPILQTTYYLLISTDVNDQNLESNENNNFISVEVNVDTTGLKLNENSINANFSFIATKEKILLSYHGDQEGSISMTLRNSLGQLIWEENDFITKNKKVEISDPNLSDGIYFFTIQQDNTWKVFKFLIHESN